MEQLDPRWRKASYSGEGANCVGLPSPGLQCQRSLAR